MSLFFEKPLSKPTDMKLRFFLPPQDGMNYPEKGNEKIVRWYSDIEYAKMYPDEKKDRTKDPYYKPQKYVFNIITNITCFC